MSDLWRGRADLAKATPADAPCLRSFPDFVRPLLEALVRDINLMINRTRRKARQNHILLARAVELTQETLRLLQPETFTKTYARSGHVSVSVAITGPVTRLSVDPLSCQD